jgi:hypothetical protein
VDRDPSIARERLPPRAELVDGDVHCAAEVPARELSAAANIEDKGRSEPTELTSELRRGDDRTEAREVVLGHEGREVDRVVGRREGRRVGQVELREIVHGEPAHERRGEHVDALVDARVAEGLCDSPHVQHITLLTLGNQKILEGLEHIDKELRTKKKTRGQPIVDANDVAKLLISLIFVLDGLGKPELDAYNRQQV